MSKVRILIVEDQAIVARHIQEELKRLGYQVSATAHSGQEAIQKATKTKPDLVLMDIELAGKMDGIEAAERIRACLDVPVIYLTAYADEETLKRAKITAPFGYILKPFEVRELHSTIEMALYRHEMERRLRQSETRYRAVSELISDFAYAVRIKPNGDLVTEWVTEAFTTITGFAPEEIKGRCWAKLIHAQDKSLVLDHLERLKAGHSDVKAFRIYTKNRKVRWLRDHGRPVWNEAQSRVVRIIGAVQDITERVRAESQRDATLEALRESERQYRTTLDSMGDLIHVVDADLNITLINPAFAQMLEKLGLETDVMGHNILEAFDFLPDDVRDEYRQVFDSGEILVTEECTEFADREIFTETRKIPISDGDHVTQVVTVIRDTSEGKRAAEALRRRNRELALVNQMGRVFNSSLDLDQVLVTVLEAMRRLLGVAAYSVWLIDPETEELVCHQATPPHDDIVRGWRLAPGQGIAGWTARHDTSLIVADTRTDERHFKGVDDQVGLEMRSILSVPLEVQQKVIGTLQVVDTSVDRFDTEDLLLVESLAATAAIAIDNARLYAQARRDAETKSALLHEVNHRVKNNLSAIIGLFYAERQHVEIKEQAVYQSIMDDLINRVQGLATVHSLLSATEWAPLQLNDLTARIINSSLQTLPNGKRVTVEVAHSPVRVTPDQAHYLALVVNELATNTVKHASQGRSAARIDVRIALEGDVVRFEFRDDGPGYPEKVLCLERHSVGFDLIQDIVRDGLNGNLSLHNDEGAVAIIEFELKT